MTDTPLDPVALFVGNDEDHTLVLVVVEHSKMGTVYVPMTKAEGEWFRETLDKAIANVGKVQA